ncbi:MAG TPA: transposase [Thermoanaerobaculia bacterium]|nr:transposase [Thermoanaerobaculia bacterium]
MELLLSWRHSGFSAHNTVRIPPGDAPPIERLARYLLRSPVALGRVRLDAPAGEVYYLAKESSTAGPREHTFERNELLARLLQHVPEPRLHQVRYYGYYSNVS